MRGSDNPPLLPLVGCSLFNAQCKNCYFAEPAAAVGFREGVVTGGEGRGEQSRGLCRCKPVRLFAFQICRRWRCHLFLLLLPLLVLLLLLLLRCLISLACRFLLCSCCPGEQRSLVSAGCGSLCLCCVFPGLHIRSALGLAKLMQSWQASGVRGSRKWGMSLLIWFYCRRGAIFDLSSAMASGQRVKGGVAEKGGRGYVCSHRTLFVQPLDNVASRICELCVCIAMGGGGWSVVERGKGTRAAGQFTFWWH